MKEIANDIKDRKIGWDSPVYKKVASRMAEHDEFLVNPVEVVEGVSKCEKCGSMKTYSIAKQVRSSDEGTSVFCRCSVCGNRWVHSG